MPCVSINIYVYSYIASDLAAKQICLHELEGKLRNLETDAVTEGPIFMLLPIKLLVEIVGRFNVCISVCFIHIL